MAIGFPAGRTPIPIYAELRRMHAIGQVDFSRVSAFLVDEFAALPAAHPGSFRQFLDTHLTSGVNIEAARVHSLRGDAPDLDAECARYEAAIDRAGGLGLLLLGLGVNGHVGFNEPGESLQARTHRVALDEISRRENAGMFGGEIARVPSEAVTMGIGTILRANRILLVAIGSRKALAVKEMMRGPVTTRLPASFLQLHPRVEVYLDRAAAAAL